MGHFFPSSICSQANSFTVFSRLPLQFVAKLARSRHASSPFFSFLSIKCLQTFLLHGKASFLSWIHDLRKLSADNWQINASKFIFVVLHNGYFGSKQMQPVLRQGIGWKDFLLLQYFFFWRTMGERSGILHHYSFEEISANEPAVAKKGKTGSSIFFILDLFAFLQVFHHILQIIAFLSIHIKKRAFCVNR